MTPFMVYSSPWCCHKTKRNDYTIMASPLHATAWPVLSSEAGTKGGASVLSPLEENTCGHCGAWHWHLCTLRGQLEHCLLDLPPSDISHPGKAFGIFHWFFFFNLEKTCSAMLIFSFCPYFFSSPLVRSKWNISTKAWVDLNVLFFSLAAQSLDFEKIVVWVTQAFPLHCTSHLVLRIHLRYFGIIWFL